MSGARAPKTISERTRATLYVSLCDPYGLWQIVKGHLSEKLEAVILDHGIPRKSWRSKIPGEDKIGGRERTNASPFSTSGKVGESKREKRRAEDSRLDVCKEVDIVVCVDRTKECDKRNDSLISEHRSDDDPSLETHFLIVKCESKSEYRSNVKPLIAKWKEEFDENMSGWVVLCLTGFKAAFEGRKNRHIFYEMLRKDFCVRRPGDATSLIDARSLSQQTRSADLTDVASKLRHAVAASCRRTYQRYERSLNSVTTKMRAVFPPTIDVFRELCRVRDARAQFYEYLGIRAAAFSEYAALENDAIDLAAELASAHEGRKSTTDLERFLNRRIRLTTSDVCSDRNDDEDVNVKFYAANDDERFHSLELYAFIYRRRLLLDDCAELLSRLRITTTSSSSATKLDREGEISSGRLKMPHVLILGALSRVQSVARSCDRLLVRARALLATTAQRTQTDSKASDKLPSSPCGMARWIESTARSHAELCESTIEKIRTASEFANVLSGARSVASSPVRGSARSEPDEMEKAGRCKEIVSPASSPDRSLSPRRKDFRLERANRSRSSKRVMLFFRRAYVCVGELYATAATAASASVPGTSRSPLLPPSRWLEEKEETSLTTAETSCASRALRLFDAALRCYCSANQHRSAAWVSYCCVRILIRQRKWKEARNACDIALARCHAARRQQRKHGRRRRANVRHDQSASWIVLEASLLGAAAMSYREMGCELESVICCIRAADALALPFASKRQLVLASAYFSNAIRVASSLSSSDTEDATTPHVVRVENLLRVSRCSIGRVEAGDERRGDNDDDDDVVVVAGTRLEGRCDCSLRFEIADTHTATSMVLRKVSKLKFFSDIEETQEEAEEDESPFRSNSTASLDSLLAPLIPTVLPGGTFEELPGENAQSPPDSSCSSLSFLPSSSACSTARTPGSETVTSSASDEISEMQQTIELTSMSGVRTSDTSCVLRGVAASEGLWELAHVDSILSSGRLCLRRTVMCDHRVHVTRSLSEATHCDTRGQNTHGAKVEIAPLLSMLTRPILLRICPDPAIVKGIEERGVSRVIISVSCCVRQSTAQGGPTKHTAWSSVALRNGSLTSDGTASIETSPVASFDGAPGSIALDVRASALDTEGLSVTVEVDHELLKIGSQPIRLRFVVGIWEYSNSCDSSQSKDADTAGPSSRVLLASDAADVDCADPSAFLRCEISPISSHLLRSQDDERAVYLECVLRRVDGSTLFALFGRQFELVRGASEGLAVPFGVSEDEWFEIPSDPDDNLRIAFRIKFDVATRLFDGNNDGETCPSIRMRLLSRRTEIVDDRPYDIAAGFFYVSLNINEAIRCAMQRHQFKIFASNPIRFPDVGDLVTFDFLIQSASSIVETGRFYAEIIADERSWIFASGFSRVLLQFAKDPTDPSRVSAKVSARFVCLGRGARDAPDLRVTRGKG